MKLTDKNTIFNDPAGISVNAHNQPWGGLNNRPSIQVTLTEDEAKQLRALLLIAADNSQLQSVVGKLGAAVSQYQQDKATQQFMMEVKVKQLRAEADRIRNLASDPPPRITREYHVPPKSFHKTPPGSNDCSFFNPQVFQKFLK